MASTSLHLTPSLRTVATEQFRAVGLALRTEAIFFISALIVLGAVVIAGAVRFAHSPQAAGSHMGFTYGAGGAIPIFLMALLIPFGVWRAEDPSRRAYHWSMPIARGPHTVMKVLSGWAWVMIATAVYLLFIIVLATLIPTITGEPIRLSGTPGWVWIAAFTATTLGYILTSIAVVGSDHAWRWIAGTFFGYAVLIGILNALGMQDATRVLYTISNGAYGLNAALFGKTGDTQGHIAGEVMQPLSMSNWLIAMPMWIIGSGMAVTIASYRHRE